MKPSYRKEKDNDYMILEAPGKPEGGEYQIRMLPSMGFFRVRCGWWMEAERFITISRKNSP